MAEATVDVLSEHSELTLDADLCRRAIHRVASGERVTVESVTIVLTDHEAVRELNRRYLGHDYETDVLSFDYRDEPSGQIDGEIYVDLDTARERHLEFDAEFEQEAIRYVVHGMLHLIGYSDENAEQKTTMRRLEDRYLSDMEWE